MLLTHAAIALDTPCCSTNRCGMQVSALSILETLKEGLRMGAQSPKLYGMALSGLRLAIRMSCAAGHHAVTDDAISMLCTATGVYSPAPPGSPHEARQLQVTAPRKRMQPPHLILPHKKLDWRPVVAVALFLAL